MGWGQSLMSVSVRVLELPGGSRFPDLPVVWTKTKDVCALPFLQSGCSAGCFDSLKSYYSSIPEHSLSHIIERVRLVIPLHFQTALSRI